MSIVLKLVSGNSYVAPDGRVFKSSLHYRTEETDAKSLLLKQTDTGAPFFARVTDKELKMEEVNDAKKLVKEATEIVSNPLPNEGEDTTVNEDENAVDTDSHIKITHDKPQEVKVDFDTQKPVENTGKKGGVKIVSKDAEDKDTEHKITV